MTLVLPKPSEDDLGATVKQLARMGGWMCTHFRPLQTKHGWRTGLEGDRGYPDWTFAHARHGIVLAELKGYDSRGRLGKPDPDQLRWLGTLRDGGVLAFLWSPDDETEIIDVLLRHRLPAVHALRPLPAVA